jgi:hypothetical protein
MNQGQLLESGVAGRRKNQATAQREIVEQALDGRQALRGLRVAGAVGMPEAERSAPGAGFNFGLPNQHDLAAFRIASKPCWNPV